MRQRRPIGLTLTLPARSTPRRAARGCHALLWLAAAASACSESGDPAEPDALDAGRGQAAMGAAAPLPHDAAAPSDASPQVDAAPRLSELVQSLFMPSCVLGRCHVTAAPAGELSFTARRLSVHAALVNAPSSELPQRMRVVPYDPDASYLIEKLESRPPTVGEPMPPLGAVAPEQIARVRAWIAAGAKDD